MIGRVEFDRYDEHWVAVLDDQGVWHCADAHLEFMLNDFANPTLFGRWSGPFGYWALKVAAEHFQGQMVVENLPEDTTDY
jgi:hypothetical protein